MRTPSLRALRKGALLIVANLAVAGLLFVVLEGAAHIVLLMQELSAAEVMRERRHTQYDPEIGWINSPGLHFDDMYGDKEFTTNSVGFRDEREHPFEIPEGRVRILCSGDSFTLGYGVGDNDTWCRLLEKHDERLIAVNLGQGGYGIDQSYLWFLRNRSHLRYDIHILAFITGDISRMESADFGGYGKCLLEVEGDRLVNRNMPVPQAAYRIPRLPLYQKYLRQLSVIRLLRRTLGLKNAGASTVPAGYEEGMVGRVLEAIMLDLDRTGDRDGGVFVAVHLPTMKDYSSNHSRYWRRRMSQLAKTHGFYYVDLIDEFRTYPADSIHTLFRGHYSEEGNAYIARILERRLAAIPDIAERLAAVEERAD